MIHSVSGKKSSGVNSKAFFIFIFLLFLQECFAASGVDTEFFPVPRTMRLQVQFWINIFTRYSKHQYIIHDIQKPEKIYRVVDIRDYVRNTELSDSEKKEIIKVNIKEIEFILEKLGSGSFSPGSLTEEEQRIYRLFGKTSQTLVFKKAKKHIRYQRGMKEKFKLGMERSKVYIQSFKRIFQEEGVPEHLIYLAHVESSFNPRAESKYGAVGIWQFTRATGQMYLTINNHVDERRDPYLSSRAAAKLLKHNYQILGNWPLAVTAYNHGLNGVKKAVEKSGSKDIDKIIKKYSSRIFGFASKNFYAEFMAVLYILKKIK
ncbi:MAG: lytic transglycosylase domain-containing protein [bacterium]